MRIATFIGVLALSATYCLADQTTPTDAPDLTPPENDRCIDATKLDVGVPVNGDNTDGNFDFVNQGVCGPRSDRRALWYEIVGAGANTTVYVCTNNEKITDYGVFNTCNSQQCTGAPPQLAEPKNCQMDESNTFSFFAEKGEDYFVHIRSDTLDPEGSNFTVWYTEDEPDIPSSAPSIAPSSTAMSSSTMRITLTVLASVVSATFLSAVL